MNPRMLEAKLLGFLSDAKKDETPAEGKPS
jgi:hypothetical protein